MRRCWLAISAALVLGLAAPDATATYSVVATDRTTRQMGTAITSCVGSIDVLIAYGAAPGHGAIDAQGTLAAEGRIEGVRLLALDTAPTDIVAAITASSFDPEVTTRQYGIADLAGRAAGYTGPTADDYKEDRQGTFGTFTYSTQGNVLTSRRVLDHAEAAFRDTGCDLADKLMLALEAGAMNGEGDKRCTMPTGIPSDSASLEVDGADADAANYLRLSVTDSGTASPLLALRAMFDDWRRVHPCFAPLAAGSGGDSVTNAAGCACRAATSGARGSSDSRDLGAAVVATVLVLALRVARRARPCGLRLRGRDARTTFGRYPGRVLLALASIGVTGCVSGERETPREQCTDFVDTYCDRAAACVAPSEARDTRADCVFYWQVHLPCQQATVTTSEIGTCLQRIMASVCTTDGYWPAIPNECRAITASAQ